jgi:predicted DNA-binding transcriptional regulator AlpA
VTTAITHTHAWTIDDIARYFQVSDRQVRRWRQSELTFPAPLALPGRTQRWDADEVLRWARQEAA